MVSKGEWGKKQRISAEKRWRFTNTKEAITKKKRMKTTFVKLKRLLVLKV